MRNIPKSINSWDKFHVAEYYFEDLRWNLTPLKKGSKAPLFGGDKRYDLGREELLTHLGNGANLGLFPAGDHVVLDLDSKQDNGKSVEKFLAQAGPKVQVLPRERTAGGVHIHLYIKDFAEVIRKFPGVRKLMNRKVAPKVTGELFFGGYSYVVTAPSVHENGSLYQWEVTGEISEWSWQEFETAFGTFLPEKILKSCTRRFAVIIGIGFFAFTLGSLRAEFLYVANGSSNNVSAYGIAENGSLMPVAGSPFPAGSFPISVAVDPLGRFVYEANSGLAFGAVSAYTIGPDWALMPVPGSPFPTGSFSDSIDSLAVDLLGRFVYVASVNGNNISAYQIGENGALTPVPGSAFPAGSHPRSVAVSP